MFIGDKLDMETDYIVTSLKIAPQGQGGTAYFKKSLFEQIELPVGKDLQVVYDKTNKVITISQMKP